MKAKNAAILIIAAMMLAALACASLFTWALDRASDSVETAPVTIKVQPSNKLAQDYTDEQFDNCIALDLDGAVEQDGVLIVPFTCTEHTFGWVTVQDWDTCNWSVRHIYSPHWTISLANRGTLQDQYTDVMNEISCPKFQLDACWNTCFMNGRQD